MPCCVDDGFCTHSLLAAKALVGVDSSSAEKKKDNMEKRGIIINLFGLGWKQKYHLRFHNTLAGTIY